MPTAPKQNHQKPSEIGRFRSQKSGFWVIRKFTEIRQLCLAATRLWHA